MDLHKLYLSCTFVYNLSLYYYISFIKDFQTYKLHINVKSEDVAIQYPSTMT